MSEQHPLPVAVHLDALSPEYLAELRAMRQREARSG